MPTYRYAIGDNVGGRIVVAQLEQGIRPALNTYLVRYACCDKEVTVQEQTLTKAGKEHNDQPAFCPKCRRQRSLAQPQIQKQEAQEKEEKKELGSPPLFATWPAPPGSVHRP